MAAEEERRARAVLAEMQMRISQGPYAALSVAESANAEQVRSAFLQLTKQFHPARFGRMSTEIQKLSNEVFLGIKLAHDSLAKQLGSTGRAQTTTGVVTLEIPRPTPTPVPGGTQRGTGLVPGASTPQLARGTDRASSRPPIASGDPASQRLATPAVGARAPSPSSTHPITPAAQRVSTPPLGVPLQPMTPTAAQRTPTPSPGARSPTPTPPPSVTGTHRTPTPTPSVTGTHRTPTPTPSAAPRSPTPTPTGVPQRSPTPQPRPTSPPSAHRPSSPPPPPSSPDAFNPPTIRYSGVQPTQPLARTPAILDEKAELRAAMDLLDAQSYAAARQALHALAAKNPQSRQYRALLCYARGRETATTGRTDDAIMEFQRALQLDPELEIAKQAIRELGRKGRW